MSDRIQLRIHGMTCAGCAASVTKALRGVAGVSEATVQLLAESATVVADGRTPDRGALVRAVRDAGYDAEIVSAAEGTDRPESADTMEREQRESMRRHRQALVQAVGLVLPILALEHLRNVLWSENPASQMVVRLTQIVLLVMLAVSPAGGPILAGGLRALWRRTANMDLLITMGVLVASISSVYGAFVAQDDAFIHLHAAAMILGLVCLGRYLEAGAKHRASAAITALARRSPKTALVRRAGRFVEAPVETIAVGDIVNVPAHSAIPADGEVIDGRASVNESLMTGEPMPAARGPGDRVIGGTLVTDGLLQMRVTQVGSASAIGRIMRLVAEAESSRTRMQRLADRVAAVFTPLVLGAAAVTFAGWLAVGGGSALADATRCAVAVLVVACPCALGLATPTVIRVASGKAALRGILVRDAASLEALGGVDVAVWDKTGTLTSGRPSVRWIKPTGSMDEASVLALAASAEQFSTHPIARAIEAAARRRSIETAAPTGFESVVGGGVSATVDGRDVMVGSLAFLGERGINDARASVKHGVEADPRDTLIGVAVDGAFAGVLGIADEVRPSAPPAVRRLAEMGVESELLTGDAPGVAAAVAAEVGILRTRAGCSPEDKVARVEQLRAQGQRVAMIGDGVNDAAALAAADAGIAFATGADAAGEAAGIHLVGSTPHGVADAVELARAGRRIIRQNLFWAMIYNVLMIPLAAAGVLPPSVAAGAMMVSSLTVVLNALRLR